MSKFRLPSTKGTEVFPNTIQAPAQIRYADVSSASEGRMLAKALEGRISQYYAKQTQAYSLGTNPIARASKVFDDGVRVSYTNIQGREQIVVHVPPEVRSKIFSGREQDEKSEVFEAALIELQTNDITMAGEPRQIRIAALIPPPPTGPDDTDAYPRLAWALANGGGQSYTTAPMRVEAASAASPTVGVFDPAGVFRASFKVDLVPYHGQSSVDVWLLGRAEDARIPSEVITSSSRVATAYPLLIGDTGGPNPEDVPSRTEWVLDVHVDWIGSGISNWGNSFGSPEEAQAALAEYHPHVAGYMLQTDPDTIEVATEASPTFETSKFEERVGVSASELVGLWGGLIVDETTYFNPGNTITKLIADNVTEMSEFTTTTSLGTTSYTSVNCFAGQTLYYPTFSTEYEDEPGPAIFELTAVALRKDSFGQVSHHLNTGARLNYFIWEQGSFPTRPSMRNFGSVVVPTEAAATDIEMFSEQYAILGVITIDIKTGGVTWEPA